MHDALLVHVLKGASHLVNVFDDALLREVHFVLHCLFYHELQVALFRPFHCNE